MKILIASYVFASIIMSAASAFADPSAFYPQTTASDLESQALNLLVNQGIKTPHPKATLFAQAQTQVAYGTHLRDGLDREARRHSRVNSQLQQERNNANAAFGIQVNHCANGSSQAYQQCVQEANSAYRKRLTAIQDEQIREEALYTNNRLKIQQYWQGQMTYPCTRPSDGTGGCCVKGNCH